MINTPSNDIAEEPPDAPPERTEIQSIFERLTGGETYTTVRQLPEDPNQALYLWEIELVRPDGNIEFMYARKHPDSPVKTVGTTIHATYYDETGIPAGGRTIADYKEGQWIFY